MLKTKALFIPVFCDVKPSDLRYPDKGVYAPSFAKHEESNVEELCTKICLAVQQEVGKTSKGSPRYVEVAKDQIWKLQKTSAQFKKLSLLPRDSHPVRIDSKVEDMHRLLQDPQIPVIDVVGMGGSGKTFLLQNVYNKTKSSFDKSIWLCVSKSYAVKILQHDIVALHIGLKSDIVDGAISEETAAELIHEPLQGKICFIVLDDLWTLSTAENLVDKLGLPADKDCKVVVTTRNKEVVQNSKAHVYEMKILSDEDSWKLFCVYAFPHCEEHSAPSHLEEVGYGIVKQCGNLPLAIKTTAASLANTKRLSKWESKRRQLERVVIPFGEHGTVMDILKLSYDSLPPHLKPFFAYLSFFHEDEEIKCEYLINLWIGEGLIPAEEEQWEMAWDWLDQLVQLCLLQFWEDPGFFSYLQVNRLIKFCKIHDLLRDLAIHISKENKCVFSVEKTSTHASAASGWCQILLAKKNINGNTNALSQSHPAYLRTLSLSQNWKINRIPENMFTTMRGLRVLNLSSTNISALSKSFGKMILFTSCSHV
ncbi:hypothetical protein SUGI_0234850 [Cryptomeria japonica]|uniref:putative disease resistance protein At3g14460 n=1 Tax=Cryptomeria japonica TaxID=3369 RepID=UPI002408A3A0|nr:putative disease resistance protein At3g14460 [Cryptomeria japonica]GLJ14512.1 hypothetical protein SUGI_0234850 [Cryptomeria japonica]